VRDALALGQYLGHVFRAEHVPQRRRGQQARRMAAFERNAGRSLVTGSCVAWSLPDLIRNIYLLLQGPQNYASIYPMTGLPVNDIWDIVEYAQNF
jgi:hypothetical protein